jgi:hypothetical protein
MSDRPAVFPLYSAALNWVYCSRCGREYNRQGEPVCECQAEARTQEIEALKERLRLLGGE